jgi:hypothetical protein
MGLIYDWFDKIKRYANLDAKEIRASIIVILVIAFAISFNKWGPDKQIDLAVGLSNLLAAIIIVAISFLARLYFQKIVALGADSKIEFKMWTFGILISLILVFITNGKLWFLIPGGIVIHYLPGHHLGWVRYGLNYFGLGVISLAGPIANILLAMIFRTLHSIFNLPIFYTAFLLNIIWAVWTMIPIPPADGSRMFLGSRMVYMFGLGIVISSALLLLSRIPVYITIPLSFIIAAIWWLVYYLIWERFNWTGPY